MVTYLWSFISNVIYLWALAPESSSTKPVSCRKRSKYIESLAGMNGLIPTQFVCIHSVNLYSTSSIYLLKSAPTQSTQHKFLLRASTRMERIISGRTAWCQGTLLLQKVWMHAKWKKHDSERWLVVSHLGRHVRRSVRPSLHLGQDQIWLYAGLMK